MPLSFILLSLLLVEIAGFIVVGQAIGVVATLGLVVLGMLTGVFLLRRQGMATLMRVRSDLAANRAPTRPLAEGALQAAGALLIAVPGFVTDILGMLLFIPAIRDAVLRFIRNRMLGGSLQASPASAPRRAVVDLARDEYGATPRPDAPTPWREPKP